MQYQQNNADFFSRRYQKEPFTEVGKIARKYNQVFDRVSSPRNWRSRDDALYRFQRKWNAHVCDFELFDGLYCDLSIALVRLWSLIGSRPSVFGVFENNRREQFYGLPLFLKTINENLWKFELRLFFLKWFDS